jgi:hypothetical protein
VANVAGGVGAFGGALKAVPALAGPLGFEGTIPQMITKGAVSGAGLSAADAAVRGQDPGDAAVEGGILGSVAGPVGRGIGKVAGAVMRGARGAAPLEHAVTTPVAGVDVPVPNMDPAVQSQIEIARKGAAGVPAQQVVQTGDAARDAALEQAKGNIGASLDPNAGPAAAPTPQDSAASVQAELQANEASRAQSENSAQQKVQDDLASLRSGMAPKASDTDLASVAAPQVGNMAPQPQPAPPVASPGAAAEIVGAGVTGRAAAARKAYGADYKAAAALPGEFAPGSFQNVGDVVRGRLNAGESPVVADTVTTPNAVKALHDLDTNVGLGNFQNEAAPGVFGPLTNVSRETQSDAALAYKKLTGMGVAPDRARASVATLPGGEGLPPGHLAPHDVSVPGGGAVSVAPKVVEASSVRTSSDPGYDATLQPRNRARAASDAQIRDISSNLNPHRLGTSAEADRGAPIVGPDGMVESGNGRVLAVRQAYADGGPAAERYRTWLAGQGADLTGVKEPLLVRERTTPMTPTERQAFTVASNQSANLSMSAPERALADARALTPDSLAMIKNPADLGAVENRPFIRSFISKLPQAEQGAMVTAKGDLSSEGLARVRNAVIGKAYGNTSVLSRIAESTDDEVRSISNALTAAAPEWAGMRASIAAGHVPAELDATKDLLDAVNRTAAIRGKGVSLADARAQGDAFSKQTPESQLFQRMFYAADGEHAAPAGQVTSALRNYAQEAMKADAAPGLDLGLAPVTARDILEGTAKKVGAPATLAKSVSDAAEAAASTAKSAGKVVDLNAVDAARKRLVSFYQDSKANPSDARATRRVLQEFDQFVIDTVDSPAYKGDPKALETLLQARAGVAAYHKQFSPQGPGDEVGRAVQKILGRHPGQNATPDQIAQMSYGSRAEPGGAQAVKVSQRLQQILGPTSPEWGAYKQGLLSHLVDEAPGAKPMTGVEKANRIDAFLNGTKGKPLAQTALSADERTALARHAVNLRASEPVAFKDLDSPNKIIGRITGRDGGPPPSLNEVTDLLMGPGDKATLISTLKRTLSPDGFNAMRVGMWNKTIGVTEGKNDLSPKRLSDNIFELLNGSRSATAQALYSSAERTEMLRLAQAIKMHIPLPGTTNPSGTAPMLTKIAAKAAEGILPLAGLMHGGIPGAIVGAVANKGVTAARNASAARRIGSLYYGAQPKVPVDPRFARAAAIAARGGQQGQVGSGP